MSREEDLRALMDQLRESACRWCYLLTADREAHEAVCVLRPDDEHELPHDLRRLIIRERYGVWGRHRMHLWGLW